MSERKITSDFSLIDENVNTREVITNIKSTSNWIFKIYLNKLNVSFVCFLLIFEE